MNTKITSTLKLGLLFGLSTLLFTSCQKDETLPATAPISSGVIIANQGQFTKNNASLSLLDLSNNTISLDVFASNNGEQLGDIAQSVTEIDGKLYVVVNNSKKIVKLNANTFKKEGEIVGLRSPRYLASAGSGKAYVTNLAFGEGIGEINVINLSTNSVIKTISCPGWTEELVSKDGKTYVTNKSSDYLYIINHSTDAISDSILVGREAQSLAFDTNGKLWIAFGQQYSGDMENGKLKRVNILSKAIELNLAVASGGVNKIRMNAEANSFFFLNGNGTAYKMNISDISLPSVAFYTTTDLSVGAEARSFYSLGFDTKRNELYVSDAGDYVSPGSVYRVSATGTLISKFTAGVSPGEFCFLSK